MADYNEYGEVLQEAFHYSRPSWVPPTVHVDTAALVRRRLAQIGPEKWSHFERHIMTGEPLPERWRINT